MIEFLEHFATSHNICAGKLEKAWQVFVANEFLRKFAMGQSNLVTQAATDPLSLLRHFTRENCATLLDILGAPWLSLIHI